MKLTLHFTEKQQQPPAAAFIRGHSAAEWLQQISRYGLPLTALECYVLPQSIRVIAPAGLFVVFRSDVLPDPSLLADAYGCVVGKLYLPVQASLLPRVTEKELHDLLLWPVQVFHPAIGLVGFEAKDRLDLRRLVAWQLPQKQRWHLARAGVPPLPGLQQIQVVPPTPEEVIDEVKEAVDSKPLADISGAAETTPGLLDPLKDQLKWVFFKTASRLGNALEKLLSGRLPESNGSGSSSEYADRKSSWWSKWMERVNQNLEELEKKRRSELERLSEMFETNSDKALEYAIPLSSPYLDRGKAPAGSMLGRRSTLFNLGSLGGGRPTDAWDIGDYSLVLRKKYLAAAEAAVARGDFKKAAYVHAHLLGNFHAAANVLKQGGFYREAAALYKDHLQQPAAAAECLEKGGLLAEATALYLQMDWLEKAGDLYRQMDQQEQAAACYEKQVSGLIRHQDHLEAARIILEKMRQDDRARQTLLEGWYRSSKAEECLRRYYDLVAELERENLPYHLEKVYDREPVPDSRFLQVLEHVQQRYPDAGVAASTRKMAYEIISRQAAEGKTADLHRLRTFLPDDRFIQSDTSRYVHRQKKPQLVKPGKTIRLQSNIKWIDAASYENQVIAIGIYQDHLYLARANWYGNITYDSWSIPAGSGEQIRLKGKQGRARTILLQHPGTASFEKKQLSRGPYFQDELVVDPLLDPSDDPGIVREDTYIAFRVGEGNDPSLNYYDLSGKLLHTVVCVPAAGKPLPFYKDTVFAGWNNVFLVSAGNCMVLINADGGYRQLELPAMVRDFAVFGLPTFAWIIVKTNTGGVLLKVEQEMEQVTGFDIHSSNARLAFVAADHFVAFGKKHLMVYQITENRVVSKERILVEASVIEVLPAPHPDHFGLLHENGIVSLHRL